MQRRHWALEVLRKEGVRSVSHLLVSFSSLSSSLPDSPLLALSIWSGRHRNEKMDKGDGTIREKAID
jgi:hypothetical protein